MNIANKTKLIITRIHTKFLRVTSELIKLLTTIRPLRTNGSSSFVRAFELDVLKTTLPKLCQKPLQP